MPDELLDDDPFEAVTKPSPPLSKTVRGIDNLQGVQPDLLNHWNNLQGEFSKAGLSPEIKAGFRTTAQQQALYNNPRTRALTKGNDGIVNISPHQEGRALDISFPATQKAKGRRIIASYAQQNGLHVPSDEPWHIAIPKQSEQDDPFTVASQQTVLPQEPDDPFVVATQQIPQGRGAAMARVAAQPPQTPLRRRQQVGPMGITSGAAGGQEGVVPQIGGEPSLKRIMPRSAGTSTPISPLRQQAAQNVRNLTFDPVANVKSLVLAATGNEQADIDEEEQRLKESQALQQTPEMIAAQKRIGSIPAEVPFNPAMPSPRGAVSALQRFGGGIVKEIGGVFDAIGDAGLGGLGPTTKPVAGQIRDWLNKRGTILQESASLPLNEQGQAIERALPEKATDAVTGLGLTVGQLVLLKRATGMSLGSLMASESYLQNSDKPLGERVPAAAESYAMGRVLDQHLSRPVSALAFGGPTAVQSGLAVAQGNKSLEDALLEAGVQVGAGAILGGGKPEGAREAQDEAQTQRNAEGNRRDILAPSGTAGDRGTSPDTVTGVPPDVVASPTEPIRHVDLQARRVRGEEAGQFKKETKAETEERRAKVNLPEPEPTERPNIPLSTSTEVPREPAAIPQPPEAATTPTSATTASQPERRSPDRLSDEEYKAAIADSLARKNARVAEGVSALPTAGVGVGERKLSVKLIGQGVGKTLAVLGIEKPGEYRRMADLLLDEDGKPTILVKGSPTSPEKMLNLSTEDVRTIQTQARQAYDEFARQNNLSPLTADIRLQPTEKVTLSEATEPSGVPEAKGVLKPLATGNELKATTERGTEVNTQYAIVDAKDLITSHDPVSLNRNEAFPEELQPRERDRAASEDQINRIAQNPRGEWLAESPKASDGAPIVGQDALVESGNGRIIGLQRAYESGKADSYRQYLKENAERLGLDPKVVDQTERPVLVRVRQSEVDRPQFVREANESSVAAMSAPEQARSDAQRLNSDLLSTFRPSESGELNTTANTPFMRNFMRDVVGPNDLGRYVGSKGEISQEGLTRIRNAIFARAYGDSPEGLRALESIAESPDSNVRNITNALLQRAGQFASLKDAIAKGDRFPLDLTSDLTKALGKLSSLREQETSVADYLNQRQLFEEDLTPLQKQALKMFDEYKRSAKGVSAVLDNYVKAVEAIGDPKQQTMFGGEVPSKESIFDAAIRETIDDAKRQSGLFSSERIQPEPGTRQDNPPTTEAAQAQAPSEAATTKEPEFVRAARERAAQRAAEKQQGIEYRHAGADPYELIDSLTVRGWELYDQKIRPTFQEWARKLREEFGPQAEEHLRKVWAQISGGEQTGKRQTEIPGMERPLEDRVGIKNAITEAERESRGLDPIEKQMYLDVGSAVVAGKKAIEEGRIDPRSLAEARAKKPQALTAEETGALAVYKANLVREQDSALNKIEEAIKGNDPQSLAEWRLREKDLDDQRNVLDAALERSGRDNSAALNARKALVDREDALVTIIRKARAANEGEISDDMRRQLTEMTKEIESLKKKIAAKPERSSDPIIRRIQDEIARESRKQTRSVVKADLDAEFNNLSAQFGRLANRAQMGLDPEMVALIGKIAKNRVQSGINTLEGVVDEIHGKLKDYASDLSKDDIRDALSGDRNKVLSARERRLTKQIADLESRISQNDLAAKTRKPSIADNERTTQLKSERDALNKVLRDLRKGTPDPLAGRKTRMAGEILKLEDRINREDFAKPERPQLLPDREMKDMQNRLADLRERRDKKIESLKKVSRWDMLARYTVGWSRAAKLTYTSTLGKLTSAATGRGVTTPIEEIWGTVPSKIFPELAKRAPRESGVNINAEVQAIKKLWSSDLWRETWRKLSAGRTSEDIMYGGKKGDMEFLSIPGRVHGAFKEPARQVELARAFEKRLTHAARSGVDIRNPDVQLALYGESYADANRAIFQQPNVLSDGFNDLMNKWSRGGGAAKTGAHVGRFLFPITKIPVNIAAEVGNYTLGLPRAAYLTAKAYRNGFENLTPQQADSIMRSWKKGGVGLGMMTLGFLNPDKFGGYYQPNEKRKPGEPGPGEQKWFGVRIPRWAGHVPILEAAQLGATIRRVMDAKQERGAAESAVEGTLAAGKGLASEVPFYETPARFFTGQEGARGAAGFAGEQVRGMIPGFVQEIAKGTDVGPSGQTTKRIPTGSFAQRFGQTIELGIPKVRENVPISPVFGAQATKASDEVQRLQIGINGVARQPDEPQKDFAQRQAIVNPYIRRALEKEVATADYQNDSDENKIERLKQTKKAAEEEGQAAYDATPRPQKFKKQKQVYPAPSGAPQSLLKLWLPPRNPFKVGSEKFKSA